MARPIAWSGRTTDRRRIHQLNPATDRAPASETERPVAGLGMMLSGGGARAAYQVGVLRCIGRHMPELRAPVLTGVSAGGINAAFLAAWRGDLDAGTRALKQKWCSLTTEEVFRSDPTSLAKAASRWGASLVSGGARIAPSVRGLVDTAPLREFLVRAIDPAGIDDNIRDGRLRALALTAMSYQTGRTVAFVEGQRPEHQSPSSRYRIVGARITADHIMASAAIPILFPAIKIGQQYYGDGSFRFTTPLSPAIHLGARHIVAVSARYRPTDDEARRPVVLGYPPPAQILGLLLNSVFLDVLDWDASRLERLNRLARRLTPEDREAEKLREVKLLLLRPSEDIGKIAASYEPRLPRGFRFLVRGLGTGETRNADLLSYMMFESAYIVRLIELGEADAEREWPRIEPFLASANRGRSTTDDTEAAG